MTHSLRCTREGAQNWYCQYKFCIAAEADCVMLRVLPHFSPPGNIPGEYQNVAYPIRPVRACPPPRLGGEGAPGVARRGCARHRGFGAAAVQAAGDGLSQERDPGTARSW